MSKSSEKRIKTFVDWFIRSEFVEGLTSDRDSDFINEPSRAARCYDAAAEGCDGKNHSEVIDDWRDAFRYWIRDRRCWNEPERFMAGVEAHFDYVEEYHHKAGSLFVQIG